MPTCLTDDLSATKNNVPPLPGYVKFLNALVVLLPFAGFIAACIYFWGRGLDALHLTVFLVMVTTTSLGVTIGFHRLFTHKSFETYAPVRFILGVLGSMSVEGPVIKWTTIHRHHHQHSDEEGDAHSPYHTGHEHGGTLHGLWYSHIGWLFDPDIPDLSKYSKDLLEDRVTAFVSRWFALWVFLGFAIPAAIGGLATMSWKGALLGAVWGGFARIFIVHHMTWSVNSVCHIWGSRPYRSHDESRNNFFFGLFSWGEGWHNNHHAFPTSARHGLEWWQLDISWIVIRAMQAMGLVWKVRLPSREMIASKVRPERELTVAN
ncbi:MAG TPA: fatty acid desaturase [Tepidisphaeraceae bacterium]|jgi:stearoyl-CoA desaturase (delta-9 desaturase)